MSETQWCIRRPNAGGGRRRRRLDALSGGCPTFIKGSRCQERPSRRGGNANADQYLHGKPDKRQLRKRNFSASEPPRAAPETSRDHRTGVCTAVLWGLAHVLDVAPRIRWLVVRRHVAPAPMRP